MREIGIEDKILEKGKLMQSAGYRSVSGKWLASPSSGFIFLFYFINVILFYFILFYFILFY